jgi:hypothetical protein
MAIGDVVELVLPCLMRECSGFIDVISAFLTGENKKNPATSNSTINKITKAAILAPEVCFRDLLLAEKAIIN